MPPMTGRVVAGRYNLQHPIGRGAMGVVWRARDQLLDREVAVKEVVISSLIGAEERQNAYQRTLREARTAARLSHRGVVTVYDVAEEDGRPWIIMELVPSRSLDQVLSVERRLTSLRAGRIGQQLLSALAAAHTAGVLHRDVKPSNVLLATDRSGGGWDERAVLTDFGIAQFEGDPRLTQTGMVMGSPGFTAPERIRGGDATPASDLWSLGATLYAASEGRGPYEQRGGAITTMSAIINEDAPVAIHAGQLARIISALMRREPSARPSASNAARMLAQVLPLLSDGTDGSRQETRPATVRPTHVPQPTAAAASAADLAAGPTPAVDSAPGDAAPIPDPEPAAEAEPAPNPAPTTLEAQADETGSAADAPRVAAEPEASEPESESESELGPELESAQEAELGADADASVPVGEAAPQEDQEDDDGAPGELSSAEAVAVMPLEPVPSSVPEETMIDRGSAGYQRTQLSIPVASPTPAPAPSFTASRPGERAAPTFSAARHGQSSTMQPPPPPPPKYDPVQSEVAQNGGYPGTTSPFPGSSGQYAGSSGQYAGSSGQYAGSSGQYAGSSGQYAGPSQPYSDLSRQYAPGSGGGRAQRGKGPWRWIILVICAAALAAAIGAGAAFALHSHGAGQGTSGSGTSADPKTNFLSVNALNEPSAVAPSGWSSYRFSAAEAGSAAAGFAIAVPPDWKESVQGLRTYFYSPGDATLEIDLTPHVYGDMVKEARFIERRAAPKFTGYKLRALQAVPVRSTDGAIWQFNQTSNSELMITDDILFIKPTPAGSQSYATLIEAPSAGWSGRYLPVFDEILRTFQTVPAS
jgi:tRNA A-37 threonylcarbamoyl transferase component Bud32